MIESGCAPGIPMRDVTVSRFTTWRDYDPTTATDEEHDREFWRRRLDSVPDFRMKRERRYYDQRLDKYGRPEGTQHWQGIYRLPRNVRRALKRPLAPLLMSGRRKVVGAVDSLLTLIGRYHTSPKTFEARGCGIGPDGGFLLDRRGLSGNRTPPGCDGLTEWSAREATSYLLQAGIIERITPRALIAVEDSKGRAGFWLKAKRRGFGLIKAPPIRYRLTALYRSLFSKALARPTPPQVPSGKPPVGEVLGSKDNRNVDDGTPGVSTGGGFRARSPGEWAEIAETLMREEMAQLARDRQAMFEDLKARAAKRSARGG